ncbi:hypothetical protein AUJ42_01895 [Candidatus Collierbacteria bacterium CG1_02_44_10]|uniref:Uncharacterized protein n=2 Tax=Microgenomates group TaxID=1794810 RepID=A0A1J4RYJ7_9BACT|nr:MAG: hypothetical protein AUJ42_01895 [Candidatus Collierbacteria bacterium CG1_02_44_10]PIU03360.1 MAG: hypothetical protein COT44_04025 [Candidatus Shapirobacteria bacterium CG08_land_8_20_14_0_20_39_18]PIY65545.1 MAG: hypothetical protein COY91_02025 [Candidatus Shapirobacteria bacterium CG_4_10_14_0_8_um_filter_39_15]
MAWAKTKFEEKQKQEAKERKQAAQRTEAINKYGKNLGDVYTDYVQGKIDRHTFIVAIVTNQRGSFNQQVTATTALLDAIDELMEPYKMMASEAHFRTSPI